MNKRILVMGHSGAGKTYFSKLLKDEMAKKEQVVHHFNADSIRALFSDYDFSEQARIRQAVRMRTLCDLALEIYPYVIGDFICPTPIGRTIFNPDIVVFMNTIKHSAYEDTNRMLIPPTIKEESDFQVYTVNEKEDIDPIIEKMVSTSLSDILYG